MNCSELIKMMHVYVEWLIFSTHVENFMKINDEFFSSPYKLNLKLIVYHAVLEFVLMTSLL